jgi:hypothetical protein
VTAPAAHIEEFLGAVSKVLRLSLGGTHHSSLRRSLLRLEEHCILRLALRASLIRPRKLKVIRMSVEVFESLLTLSQHLNLHVGAPLS